MTFSSLSEAIDWTRDHWHAQRTAPTRLHTRDMEPTHAAPTRKGCACLNCTTVGHADGAALGSHAFSRAMEAALDGSPNASVTVRIPDQPCYHPTLSRGDSPRACPECFGLGVKEHRTDRYLYPMSLALSRLAAVVPDRKHPHPYALVHELVNCGWDPHRAAEIAGIPWERYEALLLIALRKLRSRYQEGPSATRTSVGWVDKSESQRAAEVAA